MQNIHATAIIFTKVCFTNHKIYCKILFQCPFIVLSQKITNLKHLTEYFNGKLAGKVWPFMVKVSVE